MGNWTGIFSRCHGFIYYKHTVLSFVQSFHIDCYVLSFAMYPCEAPCSRVNDVSGIPRDLRIHHGPHGRTRQGIFQLEHVWVPAKGMC